MTSKPEIKITSRRQNLNRTEQNKKPTHSNFLITLNLNQQYHKEEHVKNLDGDMEIFDHLINNMLEDIEHYINLPQGFHLMMILLKMYLLILSPRWDQ